MAIVQTVNLYHFREAFRLAGRKDQFSYEALEAIFDYMEEYSEDTGEDVELDVISICCEWAEAHWSDIASDYDIDLSDCDDDEERISTVERFLENNTQVALEFGGTFVYQQF